VPPITIPKTKPKPAPEGLSQTQSYAVTLAITKPGGGLDTFDPIERLTALPSRQMPLLLELGVLKGGHRVLFAVQPAAVLYGPGTCIPGRINCQILSLGEDQIETVGLKTATGSVPLAQFAVTAVSADRHRTPAAAQEARRQTSAFGQRVLRATHLSALSLFPYMPSVGAIVDRRNLTAGGN
jgi:hypothetical protein